MVHLGIVCCGSIVRASIPSSQKVEERGDIANCLSGVLLGQMLAGPRLPKALSLGR
jgi:hypothetical protein